MKQKTVADLIKYLQDNVPMETPIEVCNPAKCFPCYTLEDICHYQQDSFPGDSILFGAL